MKKIIDAIEYDELEVLIGILPISIVDEILELTSIVDEILELTE